MYVANFSSFEPHSSVANVIVALKSAPYRGWISGHKVCRYAPVLRTGTSEKSLRQYRHFCHGWKYAGTVRTGTALVTTLTPHRPTILWKSEGRMQFRVSEELQAMHVSTIKSAAASRRLAIAFSPVFLSFIYLLTGTGCGNDSFVTHISKPLLACQNALKLTYSNVEFHNSAWTARNVISSFSGKVLKLLLPDVIFYS